MLKSGDRIIFRVSDVYLPTTREALEALNEEVELAGSLVELSDSGTHSGVFAIVELGGNQRVIVPVDKLRPIAIEALTAREPD